MKNLRLFLVAERQGWTGVNPHTLHQNLLGDENQ